MRHRPDTSPPTAARGAGRVRVLLFFGLFAALATAGLAYVFARPPVYESRAALRITAAGPAKSGLPAALADTALADRMTRTEVAVEHQQMLGHDVLDATLQRLKADADRSAAPADLAALARAVSIAPEPGSDIVTLRARGSDPAALPAILAAWIAVYQDSQTGRQRQEADQTVAKLRGQVDTLQQRLAAKRDEIESFRAEHDILSLEREENRLAARLKGLTESLNAARQEMVTAEGEVDSIQAALDAGRLVYTDQDRARLADLEDRLQEREEQVKALLDRFTERYIDLDPDLRAIVRARDDLRADLAAVRARAGETVLAAAEQRVAAARASLNRLQREYDDSKAKIAAFSSRFEEYEALQAEVQELEMAHAEARQELLRRDIDEDRGITRIDVLQAPSVPLEPIGPPYGRDAAIAGAAALLTALLAVLLYDFFTRPARREADLRQAEMQAGLLGSLFAKLMAPRDDADSPRRIGAQTAPLIDATPDPRSEAHNPPALTGPALPDPLEEAELAALLTEADAQTRLLIALLLSGLPPERLAGLSRGDLSAPDRQPALPEPVQAAVQAQGAAQPADAPLFQDGQGAPLGPADFDAMVAAAAHDAGLPAPERVDAGLIVHSYRVYLVRQGVKLTDLDRLAGPLPPRDRLAYAAFAPPGGQRPAGQVDPVHPTVKDLLAA